jgi:hypothetical protein
LIDECMNILNKKKVFKYLRTQLAFCRHLETNSVEVFFSILLSNNIPFHFFLF